MPTPRIPVNQRCRCAMVMVDVENLNVFNASYGRRTSDLLLQNIAHFGGDTYAFDRHQGNRAEAQMVEVAKKS